MKNANELVERVKNFALQNPRALHHTIEMSEYCLDNNIEGDFVECGVFEGAQTCMMAHVLMERGITNRKVHLFDSFEGIPEAGPEDKDQPGIGPITNGQGRLISSNVAVCGLDRVKNNMQVRWGIPAKLLVYHKGWFQHTAPTWGCEKIAFLRLDGDLYESYKVCLEHMYSCLTVGGILIIDDWGYSGVKKAVYDYFASIGEEFKPMSGDVEHPESPLWHIKAK